MYIVHNAKCKQPSTQWFYLLLSMREKQWNRLKYMKCNRVITCFLYAFRNDSEKLSELKCNTGRLLKIQNKHSVSVTTYRRIGISHPTYHIATGRTVDLQCVYACAWYDFFRLLTVINCWIAAPTFSIWSCHRWLVIKMFIKFGRYLSLVLGNWSH